MRVLIRKCVCLCVFVHGCRACVHQVMRRGDGRHLPVTPADNGAGSNVRWCRCPAGLARCSCVCSYEYVCVHVCLCVRAWMYSRSRAYVRQVTRPWLRMVFAGDARRPWLEKEGAFMKKRVCVARNASYWRSLTVCAVNIYKQV